MSAVGFFSVLAMLMLIDCKDKIVSNKRHKGNNHNSRSSSDWSKIPTRKVDPVVLSNGEKVDLNLPLLENDLPEADQHDKDIFLTYGDVGKLHANFII